MASTFNSRLVKATPARVGGGLDGVNARLDPDAARAANGSPSKGGSDRARTELKSTSTTVRRKRSKVTLLTSETTPLVEEEQLPPGYESPYSPILPRVNLKFPTLLSDEEEEGGNSSHTWRSFTVEKDRSIGAGEEEGVRRTYSTTKRTEHRTWTYSTSSVHDDALPGGDKTSSDRRRASSHDPDQRFPASASPSKTTSSSYSRSTSTSLHHPPRETKSSSSSPRKESRRGTTSFPGFDDDLGRSKFDPFELPSYAASPIPRTPSPTLLPAPLPPSSVRPPVYQPLFDSLFLVLFSALACCSISAILVTSFTLTAYDDLTHRLNFLRSSFDKALLASYSLSEQIEGVKNGVGRLLGGATGAFGVVAWAARGRKESGAESNGSRWRNFGRNVGGGGSRKRTLSPKGGRRTGSSSRRAATKDPSRRPYSSSGTDDSLEDLEEPFPVPYSTPHHSRTPSAASSSPSTDTEAEPDSAARRARAQADDNASTHSLPPRPPLWILIPSIVALVVLTVSKIIHRWISTRSNSPKE